MKTRIEDRLDQLFPKEKNILYDAVRYALLGGGKRLRPQLVLVTAAMLGCDEKKALDPACAIEMVHAYSLIHDDLPCMDNDDLRHGKPSLHKAYPESIALLAGDCLFTSAFEVLANAPSLSNDVRIQLIRILSRHAGGEGMIGGQVLDIESTGKTIDDQTLRTMHLGKTAALFTACLEFAACIAGAQTSASELREIGKNLGLAYQILDDLLDATQTTKQLGKTALSDAKNKKSTLVSLIGIEGTKRTLESLRMLTLHQIEKIPNSAPLASLTQKLLIRND